MCEEQSVRDTVPGQTANREAVDRMAKVMEHQN